MKKFLLCFFMCAITFTSQAFALDVQKNIEDTIKEALQKKNIQTQSVEFSSTQETLTIKGLTGANFFAPDSTMHIEEIVITKLNPLLLLAKADDMPLIAKNIEIKNVHVVLNAQSTTHTKVEFALAQASIADWKQNIIQLFENTPESNPDAYFKALTQVEASSVIYKNFTATIHDTKPIFLTLGNIALTGISPKKIASFAISDMSFKNVIQENTTENNARFTSFTTADIGLPSAEYAQFTYKNFEQIINNTLSPEGMALYNTLAAQYAIENPRGALALQGFVAEEVRGGKASSLIVLADTQFMAFNDPKSDAQIDISLAIKGVNFDLKALGLNNTEIGYIVSALQSENPSLNFSFDTSLKTDKSASTMNVSLSESKGAYVNIQAKGLFPEAKFSQLFALPLEPTKFAAFLSGADFTELHTESGNISWKAPNMSQPIVAWAKEKTSLIYDPTSDANVKISQETQGLTLNLGLFGMSNADMKMVEFAFGTATPTVDTKLAVDLSTAGTPSTLNYSAEIQKALAVQGQLTVQLPQEKISVLVINQNLNQIINLFAGATFSNFKFDYIEKGILPRLLKLASTQIKTDARNILAMTVSEALNTMKQQAHLFTPTSSKAVELCLQKMGTLSVYAEAQQPLPFTPQSLALLSKPDALSIDVTCQPGADILELTTTLEAPAPTQQETKAAPTQQETNTDSEQKATKTAPEQQETNIGSEQKATDKPKQEKEQAKNEKALPATQVEPASPQVNTPEEKVTTKAQDSATEKPQSVTSPETAQSGITAPKAKKAGSAILVFDAQDMMGLTSFGADQKADTCVRAQAQNTSPLTGIRVESFSGTSGSWKTKDVKAKALGVLVVMQDGSIINADDASFSLDVTNPTTLDLCMQDNGAFADEKARLRIVFFHKDNTRRYSVITR